MRVTGRVSYQVAKSRRKCALLSVWSMSAYSTSQKFEHTFPFPWMRKCVQTFDWYCSIRPALTKLYLHKSSRTTFFWGILVHLYLCLLEEQPALRTRHSSHPTSSRKKDKNTHTMVIKKHTNIQVGHLALLMYALCICFTTSSFCCSSKAFSYYWIFYHLLYWFYCILFTLIPPTNDLSWNNRGCITWQQQSVLPKTACTP